MNNAAFTTGLLLGFTLIVAIGAQNAFVLRQGLRREHVLAIVVFCILSDVILIAAGVAGLAEILGNAPALTMALTIGGTLFLLIYGLRALRSAFRPRALNTNERQQALRLRSAIAQAAGFTFLNPHVYLDTVLLLGSIGARHPPDTRAWFIGGAALASIGWFSALGFGARMLAPVFARSSAWRVFDILVGLTMLALALVLATKSMGT
jgi:L-lysine exporter family protein LysE/ArgO